MFYCLKAAAVTSARGCALLGLLLALAVSGSGDAVAEPLSGAEIQLLLAGNSAHYDDDGAKQSFHKHGATFYQLPGRPADRGNWWVSGDKYCSRWGRGGTSCYGMERVQTEAGERFLWNGGYKARIVPGDALQ